MKKLFAGWKTAWTECITVVLLLRFIYACVGVWIRSSGGAIPLNERVYGLVKPYLASDQISQLFVNPWFQWDTISYLQIAILGYQHDASTAFMPLYPVLIRLFAPVFGGNYLLTALVLSTIFCIIVLILMHELFAEIYSEAVARRTIGIFASFPTAFFLLSGYTESLFLILVLAFWLLARRQRWLGATLCAGLATLTRLQGIALGPVLLWMILVSHSRQPESGIIGQLRQIFQLFISWYRGVREPVNKAIWVGPLVPLAVAAGYQAWLRLSGYGTINDALRTYWRLETVPPWTGFFLFLQRLPSTHFSYMDWVDLALFVLVLIGSLAGLRALNPAFSIYIWLTLGILMTRGTPPHLLASYSRYFLTLFPLFVLPALWPHRYQQLLMIAFFFTLQILLVAIFLRGSWVA